MSLGDVLMYPRFQEYLAEKLVPQLVRCQVCLVTATPLSAS